MAHISVRDNEHTDAALRRFKRACEKDNILGELRRREAYVTGSELRKRAKAAARKRHLKALERAKPKRRGKRRSKQRTA